MQVKDILKKSSNEGDFNKKKFRLSNEFKYDLDQIGLLKSAELIWINIC